MKPGKHGYTPRLKVRIPISIRRLDSAESSPRSFESTDISARGLYFETDLPLKVGTPVRVTRHAAAKLYRLVPHRQTFAGVSLFALASLC